MLTTQQTGRWPFDKANAEVLDHKLEWLEKFVDDTVAAMAKSLSVSPEEALNILNNVHHVEMMDDLMGTVQTFGDKELLRRVGPEKMCREIEDVIRAISYATALDTDEITAIFADKPGASIANVSYRLHLRSLVDRSYTS